MHREKDQSSKHQTQNSDHEGKILLHSSIYKHETDYKVSVSGLVGPSIGELINLV